MMKRVLLSNGMRLLVDKRKSDSVTIEVCVHTGSNNEPAKYRGVSHFLEHMLFEGTKTRTAQEIAEAIENVGGDMNAFTTNERTAYYIKIPKKHFKKGLTILHDMLFNSVFDEKAIEKERNVILEEIKMTEDQPLRHQWLLFETTLYSKYPTRFPVYGTNESVNRISRKFMMEYHRKWYVPSNMSITVAGDASNCEREVKKLFGKVSKGKLPKISKVTEPSSKKVTVKKKKMPIQNAYVVLGYKTVPAAHKDTPVLEVIRAIMGKGMSGRIVDEIRVKRGLVYSVGTMTEYERGYGFFAVSLNTKKDKVELCRKLILKELSKISEVTDKELKEAKEFIVGKHLLDNEDTQNRADLLSFWEHIGDSRLSESYLKNIREVSKKDMLRVANKYFKNYTMVVLSN